MSGIGTPGDDEIHGDSTTTMIDGGAGDDLLVMDLSNRADPQAFTFWPNPANGYIPAYKNIEHLQIVTGSGDDTGYFTDLIYDTIWGGNFWDAGAGNDVANVEMSDSSFAIKSAVNDAGQMVITNRSTKDVLLTLANVESYNIDGTPGSDVLAGGAGNDVLGGGKGTNTLDGGAGFDTALMDNFVSAYQVVFNADGSVTLTAKSEKTTVTNIEAISFYDTVAALGTNSADNYVEQPGVKGSFFGGGGDDTYTGVLFQTVDGGDGNDTIVYQGVVNDFLNSTHAVISVETMIFNDGQAQMGSAGDDTLAVAAGVNFLIAGKGNDIITDGQAGTTVYGGDGNDAVTVTAANITIQGGAGDDAVTASAPGLTVHGGDGNDSVYLPGTLQDYHPVSGGLASAAGSYLLDSVENVYIGAQRVIFVPTGGTTGGSGDDLFIWDGTRFGSINDGGYLYGGGGNDILVLNNAADSFYLWDSSITSYEYGQVYLDAWDSSGQVFIAEVNLNGISTVQFSDAAVTIGTSGNDQFNGTDGNDGYFGSTGDDVLAGGAGDDNLEGGSGHDLLDGGAGNDTLIGGGNAELTGGAGDDTLIGINVPFIPTNTSVAVFSAAHSAYTITLGGTAGSAVVTGPDGTDTLKDLKYLRFADGKMLIGSSLADDLTPGSSVALVYTGDGNDKIHYTSGNLGIDGGAGMDTVYMPGKWQDASLTFNADGTVSVVVGNKTVTLTGIEKLQFSDRLVQLGTGGADTLDGGSSAAIFVGGPGNDQMTTTNAQSVARFYGSFLNYAIVLGAGGTMTVSGPDGADTLAGFSNLQFDDDSVVVSGGVITATTPDGSVLVTGSPGDDYLFGSSGKHNDFLDGGVGADTFDASGFGLDDSTITINADGTTTLAGPDGTDTLRNIEQIHFYNYAGPDRRIQLGTAGNDTVTAPSDSFAGFIGGPGDDTYTFTSYNNVVFMGGSGFDTAIFNDTAAHFILGGSWWNGQLQLNVGDYTVRLPDVEKLQFTDGSVLVGDGGDNTLNGGAGNDLLIGQKGNDQLNGGDGYDKALFAGNFSDYTIQVSGHDATVTGPDGTDTLTGVEEIGFSGPQQGRVLIGSDNSDQLGNSFGEPGVSLNLSYTLDLVYGNGGDDVFTPSSGVGRFDGGEGNDMVSLQYGISAYTVTFNQDGSVSLTNGNTLVLTSVEKAHFASVTAWLGTIGDDALTGTANDEFFLPGPGNDTIDGGGGTDVVLFSGNPNAYRITRNGDGSYAVSGPDGIDILRNVEYAAFAGKQIAVRATPTAHDFDADGRADILWQNADGTAAVWLLNGTTLSGGNTIGNPGSASWSAIGTGDFDGDGKADILWQNTDGTAAVWLMNGSTLAGGGIPGNPGAAWTVLGAADFNGDGKSDILWRDGSGNIAIWLMNGSMLTGGAVAGNPGDGWSYKGNGDFNGDGKTDLVFQNVDGSIAIWLMDGASIAGGAVVGNPGGSWAIKAVGDFDGGGKSDLLLQDAGGQAAIWEMNGTSVVGGGLAGANPGTTWTVKQAEDVNGDGKADILWQAADGSPAVWLMSGANVTGGGIIGGNPGSSWHMVSA